MGAGGAVSVAALRAFLEGEAARHAGAVCHVVTLPAPALAASALVRFDPTQTAVFWQRGEGEAWAGCGAAKVLRATGDDRFVAIRDAGARLLAAATTSVWPGVEAVAPRLFGGFAFSPGSAAVPPWQPFGDALFVLPRWLVVESGTGTRLAAVLGRDEGARVAMLGELAAIFAAARAGRGDEANAGGGARVVVRDSGGKREWRRAVESIRALIAAGECEKIVASRAITIGCDRPLDPAAVLARLGDAHPSCTRFLLRHDRTAFVGATPEHLVAVHGRRVDSEALAGSIAAVHAGAAEVLLASGKDRREHDLVLRQIVAILSRFCTALDWNADPGVRALPAIVHLHTPITGELVEPRHVLDLVAALHPTPAVGGVPTAAALAWVAGHEFVPRGWYAGPIGFFDRAGDGEFAVALRAGVIRGAMAVVHAGAGIVADSVADREFAETELKAAVLLVALGVDA